MKHVINITGIKLYGYHGCLEEEAKVGGHYVVDVHITSDFTKAAQTDDLALTIDYCTVYEISKKEMAIRSKLIEQVCSRIFNNIKSTFSTIEYLHVIVTKLTPPMNGDVEKVSVEMKG